jgi:hypothetical protein
MNSATSSSARSGRQNLEFCGEWHPGEEGMSFYQIEFVQNRRRSSFQHSELDLPGMRRAIGRSWQRVRVPGQVPHELASSEALTQSLGVLRSRGNHGW